MIGIYDKNNIYLEDSMTAVKKFPDNSVDCIYIDIPYLYTKGGQSSCLLGQRLVNIHNELKNISDGIDYKIFDDFIRIMKRINIFIWCSKEQIQSILNYFLQFNVNYDLLIWAKTNPVPRNNSFHTDLEYCLFFREKNYPLNKGYSLKSKWFLSPINKSDKDLFGHPTIKPYEFVKNHLLLATKENDLVVDFYMGSGTTCVIAKDINRKFIGFDNDEKYFNISYDRLKLINNKQRKEINKGQLYFNLF